MSLAADFIIRMAVMKKGGAICAKVETDAGFNIIV
jgi:hypothetical protein